MSAEQVGSDRDDHDRAAGQVDGIVQHAGDGAAAAQVVVDAVFGETILMHEQQGDHGLYLMGRSPCAISGEVGTKN